MLRYMQQVHTGEWKLSGGAKNNSAIAEKLLNVFLAVARITKCDSGDKIAVTVAVVRVLPALGVYSQEALAAWKSAADIRGTLGKS